MKKAVFNWSGGKDSAIALHYILKEGKYQVSKLLTSVNSHHHRISMHGVRVELLEQQTAKLELPLEKLMLPEQPQMAEYEEIMGNMLTQLQNEGITHSIFGDIFLEDLKTWRENKLSEIGMKAVFPLWKKNTLNLLHEFVEMGFKTIIVCCNAQLLDKSFAGMIIDRDFIKDLPKNVDPCGENGEFHTFVFDGPIFKSPVEFTLGETVYKEYDHPNSQQNGKDKMGFWFADLINPSDTKAKNKLF